jgi:predicted Co/Zn/Cd cation transporter (cation efflux family)
MEIEAFIGELCWQIEEMQKKDSEVEYSLRVSEAHFNGLMEEITRYYREIEDIIEVQKYTTYNAVLGQRSAI